jgi:hypothetical protein
MCCHLQITGARRLTGKFSLPVTVISYGIAERMPTSFLACLHSFIASGCMLMVSICTASFTMYRGLPGTLDIKPFCFHVIQRNDAVVVDQLWSCKPDDLENANFPAHYKNDTITALQLAVTLGHTAVLQQLLSYRSPTATYRDGSAKPSFNPKEQTQVNKTTVLHKAAHYCSKQLVQLCLDQGANPLIPSNAGSLPHHICAFRACEQRGNGDDSRYAEYMAIARLLLKACENEWYRGCEQAIEHADVCAHKRVKWYNDEAKAFLQEVVRLNAEETAAAVAVAVSTAIVPAAAAVAVQPAAAAAAAAAAAGTVAAGSTGAIDFKNWRDDSGAAAVGGSCSSTGVSFSAMLHEAQRPLAVTAVQQGALCNSQYSVATVAACAQTAIAPGSSTAIAAAANFRSGALATAAAAAAAAATFTDSEHSNAQQQQCELSDLPGDDSIMSEKELFDNFIADGDALMQLDDVEVQRNSIWPTEVMISTDDVDTASSTARSNKRLRPNEWY